MKRRRTIIVLRERDDEGEYITEWEHEENVERDDFGISINWGNDYSWFPYAAILRVDNEICKCYYCDRANAG